MIRKLLIFYLAPSLLSTVRINMEPVNLGYSTKNIPIAPPKEYLKFLFDKTESFLYTTCSMESIQLFKVMRSDE